MLPFLTFSLLTILQFYFLHRRYKFVSTIVVNSLLLKQFVIYHFSTFKKQSNPTSVKHTTYQEDQKDEFVIYYKYNTKHNKRKQRKHYIKYILCQEVVYPTMIIHALHQVSHKLCIKE